jgi:hypothetical protein
MEQSELQDQWRGKVISVPTCEKIKRGRCAFRNLAIYTVRENRNGHSEPTSGIVRGVLGTSAFSPSKPGNAPLTVSGD